MQGSVTRFSLQPSPRSSPLTVLNDVVQGGFHQVDALLRYQAGHNSHQGLVWGDTHAQPRLEEALAERLAPRGGAREGRGQRRVPSRVPALRVDACGEVQRGASWTGGHGRRFRD